MHSNYKFVFVLLSFLILMQSCKFDLFEKIEFITPTVSILDMEIQQDTVFIIVDIIDNGAPVEVIGIAYKIGEDPHITDNQQFYGGESGTFSIPIVGINGGENYTFMAFAGNDYTLGYSEPVSFDIPTNFGFRAPCALTSDELEINGVKYPTRQGGSSGSFLTGFRLSPSSFDFEMDIFFTEPPLRGVYTTSLEGVRELSDGNSFIVLTIDNYQSNIKAGSTIYVDKEPSGNYIISFCDLKWRGRDGEVLVKGLVKI